MSGTKCFVWASLASDPRLTAHLKDYASTET